MHTVGTYQAKTCLSQLLDEVETGKAITITRHGRPVAVLAPPPGRRADRRRIIDELRVARRIARLEGLPVRDLIDEGRR